MAKVKVIFKYVVNGQRYDTRLLSVTFLKVKYYVDNEKKVLGKKLGQLLNPCESNPQKSLSRKKGHRNN